VCYYVKCWVRAGPRGATKPSPEFQSLLSGLLEKDCLRRIDSTALVSHPFWQGTLDHLAHNQEGLADVRASVHQSISNFVGHANIVHELPLNTPPRGEDDGGGGGVFTPPRGGDDAGGGGVSSQRGDDTHETGPMISKYKLD